MIATQESFEPHSSDQLPNSKRIYVEGQIHKDVRVPMREISLSPTKSFNGRIEMNEPVRVYDCAGPWGDPTFHGKSEEGLPALREPWIAARNDVAAYDGREVKLLVSDAAKIGPVEGATVQLFSGDDTNHLIEAAAAPPEPGNESAQKPAPGATQKP